MVRSGLAPLLLLVTLAAAADAQEGELQALRWLAGCWLAGAVDSWTEEIWTAPAGGLLLGISRSVSADRGTAFEYMRIETGPGGTVLIASPSGRPGTAFPAVVADGTRFRVERPDHDFPRAIEYRPMGRDSLVARVFGEVAGAEPSFTLRFGRVDCPGDAP